MIFQKLLFKIDSRNIGLGILEPFAMKLLTYFAGINTSLNFFSYLHLKVNLTYNVYICVLPPGMAAQPSNMLLAGYDEDALRALLKEEEEFAQKVERECDRLKYKQMRLKKE